MSVERERSKPIPLHPVTETPADGMPRRAALQVLLAAPAPRSRCRPRSRRSTRSTSTCRIPRRSNRRNRERRSRPPRRCSSTTISRRRSRSWPRRSCPGRPAPGSGRSSTSCSRWTRPRTSARFSARSARSTWSRSTGTARRGSASRRRSRTRCCGRRPRRDAKTSALRGHFQNLKDWIAGAYYSSETGMRELGWDGNVVHAQLPGCTHPGGHQD